MARIKDVVIDCVRPASVARFWAAALDGYALAPYDDAEIARLAAIGIDDVEDDPTVLVVGPDGAPRFYFRRVDDPTHGKNRVHLDLRADDQDAEAVRLVALGAQVFDDRRASGDRWIVMTDPEGNEFCLFGAD